ncbi:MAG: ABC transporter ATP-binding protein [Planctomycetota bacterium]
MIQLSSVSKRLGGKVVLDSIDLSVPRGTLFGLIGLNGAGKTTLLRIALGCLRADSGEVKILDKNARGLAAVSGRVGAALHGTGLDPSLTARENLLLHALYHGRGGRRRVDTSRILERLDLEAIARRRVSKLSQGERQRLALARALMLEPEVLILDEPLSHLDPGAVEGMLDLLREEASKRGVAVLLSSHQLEHVERSAGQFALLHRGKMLLSGTMEELLRTSERMLLVAATPLDGARAVIDRLLGPGRVEPPSDVASAAGGLRVALGDADPADLNAALHEAGVRVSRLSPERRTLHETFRNAVRRADRGEEPA